MKGTKIIAEIKRTQSRDKDKTRKSDTHNKKKHKIFHRDDRMSHRLPPIFSERRGNPYTTRQATDGHKTTFYTGTAKELPL